MYLNVRVFDVRSRQRAKSATIDVTKGVGGVTPHNFFLYI